MVKVKQILAVAVFAMLLCLAGCGAGDAGNNQEAAKQDESMDMLTFTAQFSGASADITYWGDGKDTYYFFLPSGCTPGQVFVTTRNGITLRREDDKKSDRETFDNGEFLKGIECDTTYLLGCRDKTGYVYELPVVFMQGANVHSVFITTQSGSIKEVLEDRSVKEKGDILITAPDGSVIYDGALSYIKGRGNGSWYSHKKPFNIKLAEKAEIIGTGASRGWCLINQELDLSCLRNKIAYDIAADAGLAYSPDCEFADLWIDGEYFGLYLLTDKIGISEASVDITDLEKATEAVNMDELKTYPAGSVIPTVGKTQGNRFFMDIPNNPDDITGGYLIEVDKFYPQHKTSYFNTGHIYSVTLKSPEYATRAQVEYIREFINNMEAAIDTPVSRAYQNYLDIDSWTHMCVLEEILADSDYMGSSQYYYKDADSAGKRSLLYAGPIWDKDLSLGNTNSPSYVSPRVLLSSSRSWIEDLYNRPEFYRGMVASYRDIFRPLFVEMLNNGIDAYAEQTAASVKMNYIRWASAYDAKPSTFREDDVKEIKDFIEERIALLDDLWLNGSRYHAVRAITSKTVQKYADLYYGWDYMVPAGEPLGELPAPRNTRGYTFEGWFYGTPDAPGKPYDPAAPVTADITVFAKFSDPPS